MASIPVLASMPLNDIKIQLRSLSLIHITLRKLSSQLQCWSVIKKDQLTVAILILPILFGLLNTCLNSELRWKPSEYLAALFNPIMVPYLGFQTIRKPEDEETRRQYWRLKVSQPYLKDYKEAYVKR